MLFYIQITEFSIDDQTVLARFDSPLFEIFEGGSNTNIAVTVIDTSTLSTIGGTVFTPYIGLPTAFQSFLTPTQTITDVASATASDNPSSATQTSSGSTGTETAKGLSIGAKVGIGIGIGLSVLLAGALVGDMIWRKRHPPLRDDTIPLNDVKAWGLR